MTTPRHQYVDPMVKPKAPKVKYVSTWNDRERKTVRFLMMAVAVFAVIVAIGGYYLIDLGSKTQDAITRGHQDRIDFQNSIQSQANQNKKDIKDLACYAANAAPRGTSHFLDGLAKKYDCPPYKKTSFSSKASLSHGPAPSPSRANQEPPSSLVAQGGGAGQTSSPVQSSGGGSSSIPTPTPTPTSTICVLPGLLCLSR